MSRIIVLLGGGTSNELLVRVNRVLGGSLAELLARVKAEQPVCDIPLFGNDHHEGAATLRRIADLADDFGAALAVYEVEPDEAFDTCPRDQCAISVETMRNILNAWDRRVRDRDG